MHPINQHPILVYYNQHNEFGRKLGMEYELLEPGKIRYTLKITPEVLATQFAAHGGVIATLMDAVLGVAALSLVCEKDQIVSTVELSVNFLKPALLNDELIGEAECVHQGNRLLYFEGKIKNQRNEVVAAGKGTFNAYPKEKANYALKK